MWRTALRPRWLGLLGLAIVIVVAFVELGLWQLNAARDAGRAEQVARIQAMPTADIAAIVGPHAVMAADAVGRSVSASGRYDADQQVLVAHRRQGDRQGFWVVTPLVVEGTGARLPVLRGFVGDAASAPAPPAGRVGVTGTLSPPESAPNEPVALPPGQIQSVDLANLVNEWDASVYNALVFAGAETADGAAVPTGGALTRVPPPDLAETELSWRNLAYAAQWWVFAAFVLYMWSRMVADDHHRTLLAAAEDREGAPAADGGDDAPSAASTTPASAARTTSAPAASTTPAPAATTTAVPTARTTAAPAATTTPDPTTTRTDT